MQQFQLGVTMAGAISAGAYSGGVFDMLFEVLEAWQQAKDAGEDVPTHDVVVPVISGASAGSITGAIGLVALADKEAGYPESRVYDGVGTVTSRLPRLYATWVTGPRFVAQGNGDALLGQADLKDGVYSVLDTTILDRIAERAVAGFATRGPRKYLTEGVHLFVTVSNLQGVPYAIPFSGGDQTSAYIMTSHADRVHFSVRGVGSAQLASDWADPDPALPLDVASLVGDPAPHASGAWRGFIDATLGSSAFPVGLRARALPEVPMAHLAARQWPITGTPDGPARFHLPPADGWTGTGMIRRRAVDGGVIDNEPFELARWTVMKIAATRNERSATLADRAVLMIDPFPSASPPAPALPDGTLMSVLRHLLPMLIDQARFKLDAVVDALNPEVNSRFLISPRRYTQRPDGTWKPEPHAIACGLTGGFGGFLSEAMRAHDYQLGRYTAYRFLKRHFCFPVGNTVLGPGYAGVAAPQRFRGSDGPKGVPEDEKMRYQMIPVMDTVEEPEPPQWPRVGQREVDDVVRAAGARAMALLNKTAGGMAGWTARRLGLRDAVESFVRWTLMTDLYRRNQFAGLPAAVEAALADIEKGDDGRKVLSALADPGYAARTAQGIEMTTGVKLAEVDRWITTLAPLLEQGTALGNWKMAARPRPGLVQRMILGEGRIG